MNNNYKCPVGLLGISVLFWSWSLHIWPVGLVMAITLEGARWIPWRMKLREKDFMRIADLTAVAFAIIGITLLVTNLYESLFLLAEWLPLIVYLLMSAQLYSATQTTPLMAVVASLRRRKTNNGSQSEKTIDLRLPYFFIILVAASIAAPKSQAFYVIMFVLLLWALWPLRTPRFKPATWLTLMGSAFSLGFFILTSIAQLQSIVQEFTTQWFQADWSQRNMQRNSTAMGQIGRLKLSEQIFMRIQSNYGTDMLLQQASYNRFSGITWHSTGQQNRQINRPEKSSRFVLLSNPPQQGGELSISSYLNNGEGVLALPLGTYAIENQRNAKLYVNDFGTTRIEQNSSLLDFKVYYQQDFQNTVAPTPHDLDIPKTYRKLLNDIVSELQLKQLPPKVAAVKLQEYFQKNFQYSLIQDSTSLVLNPLSTFLTTVRKGHCEYFATAGALILRAAGIPTRYATGYLMSELDTDSNQFIVRSRHAHAWTLAYINNKWEELDYTPPTWAALESDAAPWWQDIYDTASNSKHILITWWYAKPRSPGNYALSVLFLLAAFILLRKFKAKDFSFRWQKQLTTRSQRYQEKESPFDKITEYFNNTALARKNSETIKQWICRLPDLNDEQRNSLNHLAQKHYHYRFDRHGDNNFNMDSFRDEVDRWFTSYTS